MGLKTPAEYRESLRDGRVTYWQGDRIADITKDKRFEVPIRTAMEDYEYYTSPEIFEIKTYETEAGERAARIFQIPKDEEAFHKRIALYEHETGGGGGTG